MRYSTRNTLKCITFSPELCEHLKYFLKNALNNRLGILKQSLKFADFEF